ncbi:MAG: transcription-repair coupling factor [Bacteroidia bacterium]|nr:transcription-repair coupling factor [Bacteroidia bacterium]MCZ2277825.1 transcription-repair coupling factor [Bacteroidia bacterium]
MTNEELRQLFSRHPVTTEAFSFSALDKKQLILEGLAGSAPAFLLASVYDRYRITLAILPDTEQAAYFANDLMSLIGETRVHFFPSSFKKSLKQGQIDTNHILARSETLSHISRAKNPLVVVTCPPAIHEKVVGRQQLNQNTFKIQQGEVTGMGFLQEFLDTHGFRISDFVYEPGQYSLRGGIIDVFSFGNEMPYRIEFNGDRIESVRCFNPVSQLSEQQAGYVTIVPDFSNSKVYNQYESLLSFLPHESVIWAYNLPQIYQSVKTDSLEIPENGEIGNEEKRVTFLQPEELVSQLENFSLIQFGNMFNGNGTRYSFNQSPQPSFNKNFDLLFSHLQEYNLKSYKPLILCDSAKQVERLYSIYEHSGKEYGDHLFSAQLLSIHEGFTDHQLKITLYTDHQVFNRYHRYRVKRKYTESEAISLKELYSLQPGDYITHIDHGVGRFAGLEKIYVNGREQEAIRLIYKDNDVLYISIHALNRISRYSGKDGTIPALNKLGSNSWSVLKQKTKKKVKDIAKDLIALYAKRKLQKGFAYSADSYLQTELEASFVFEDTPDQIKSTQDVKKDMESAVPMDRLICGDVGFGKTEIAIRAAFKAVTDGKQAAVLVPTTILALQHFRTFSERLRDFPCSVDFINRFKSPTKQKETLTKLKEGKTDIIIGTHRLLSKDVLFKDLGLLIIDEEQKFGVSAKEKIKQLKINVDTLTLTATPIPRTLQFSLMGARDLSIINTPPASRFPVTTELHVFSEEIIHDTINFELARGGQVFFVHNRISNLEDLASMIRKLCPGATVSIVHGQMESDKLEKEMMNFIEGETDVLLSTTIIESGLDISNANTIIINQAQHYGLSDLHQMRGRVGRSNKKAFCYLLTPPHSVLTSEARQRLKACEEFSELGSGFQIAMRDLDIRGAGNILGGEQSGFISEVGFEMYHKILDEAITELKETEFKDLFSTDETPFATDCQIETDLEILIPTSYVESTNERLKIYQEMDHLTSEHEIIQFKTDLADRFGPIPKPVHELIETLIMRQLAKDAGFEKIIIKREMMRCYFPTRNQQAFFNSEKFDRILSFIRSNENHCLLKQEKNSALISVAGISSIASAVTFLRNLNNLLPVVEENKIKSSNK